MKKAIISLIAFSIPLFSHDFPLTWSQSYCTYDIAEALQSGEYSLGFGINNYCIWAPDGDTINYDERKFDIFANLGIFKHAEIEIKYSYLTSGLIAIKYQFFTKRISAAFKFGFGYMKGTRVNKITDYIFDFYPTLILSTHLTRNVALYFAPKAIYSLHIRDRQEQSDRAPGHIFQRGFGFGVAIGNEFSIRPETNWLFGNNEGVTYTVIQFGIGVNLKIR
jgi:hypothetical protein